MTCYLDNKIPYLSTHNENFKLCLKMISPRTILGDISRIIDFLLYFYFTEQHAIKT
jgi:hypothetical protein